MTPDVDVKSNPADGRGVLEVVAPDPSSGIRCHSHDWPHPLARWHHHPEIEIHLIRDSTGIRFIGDHAGPFYPGDLCLIGSGLPHNWISSPDGQGTIPLRDGVVQFNAELFGALSTALPDLLPLDTLIQRASRGLLISGRSAERAIPLMEDLLLRTGPSRVAGLIELLTLFVAAPASELEVLSSAAHDGPPAGASDPHSAQHVDAALAFITAHLSEPLDRDRVANAISLSPTSLSRVLKQATGFGVGATIGRLRVSEARRHLAGSSTPIADIAADVGYINLSTFNRQFKEQTGMSPREYRRWASEQQH